MNSIIMQNVSHETLSKLDNYFNTLEKWQAKINLIGTETLPEAPKRHFEDSLQLTNYIPPDIKTLHDLGQRRRLSGPRAGHCAAGYCRHPYRIGSKEMRVS